jgi:hypothetical protein
VKIVCLSVCLFLSLFACLRALGTPYDAKMAKLKKQQHFPLFLLMILMSKIQFVFSN